VHSEALLTAVGEYLSEYMQRLLSLLRRLRKLAGIDGGVVGPAKGSVDVLSDTDDWSGYVLLSLSIIV
jgi:hypothetical protein